MLRFAPLLALCAAFAGSCTSGSEVSPKALRPLPKLDKGLATVLADADSWTLYALNPQSMWADNTFDHALHDYEILGEATISDLYDRQALTDSLAKGIRANDGKVAACFNPRHGISARTEDGRVDLVICFECYQIYVYAGDGGERVSILTTDLPRPTFDRVFRDAGLTIAK